MRHELVHTKVFYTMYRIHSQIKLKETGENHNGRVSQNLYEMELMGVSLTSWDQTGELKSVDPGWYGNNQDLWVCFSLTRHLYIAHV